MSKQASMSTLPRKQILQSEVTCASFTKTVDFLGTLAANRLSSYVCVANVHMLIETYLDPHFLRVMQNAEVVTPDGKPLSICMNLLYGTRQERVPGQELMLELLKKAESEKLSVFFYGSTEEVLSVINSKLQQEFPHLLVAGSIAPPFRPLSEEEDAELVEQINQSGAHFVFVALGCPKQEKWMYEHYGKVNAVMLGVGAAFPFYSGHLQRCPQWMQNFCLEWLYRLYREPKRLFWRYFISNSLFLLFMAKQIFAQLLFKKKI